MTNNTIVLVFTIQAIIISLLLIALTNARASRKRHKDRATSLKIELNKAREDLWDNKHRV